VVELDSLKRPVGSISSRGAGPEHQISGFRCLIAEHPNQVLTYLSIIITIQILEAAGGLVRHRPTVRAADAIGGPRHLWLTPDTRDWCFPSAQHPDARVTDEALAQMGDRMNAFVFGQFMEDGIDMKRLEPVENGVWEIRSYFKKPFLRVFGWFVLPKLFVAAHCKVRHDLEETRGPKWDRVIAETMALRDQMFGGDLLYQSNRYNDFVRNPG
jgi:hypothetical protein